MPLPVYLDHHSTTPCDPRVVGAMLPFFSDYFGNPSNQLYVQGQQAKNAVEEARAKVAYLISCSPEEIIFTSGATEANNLSLAGYASANKTKGRHIISARTEHKSVLDVLIRLGQEGFEITWLPVDAAGHIDPETLKQEIRPETILVSLMLANNEIGTLHPISAYTEITSKHGIAFHTDAVQAIGKLNVDVKELGVDLLALSAHKVNGPKGIGALYIKNKKPRLRLTPLIVGGGQEKGLRSGTPAVPNIVGLGKACEILTEGMETDISHYRLLRNKLWETLEKNIPGFSLNGDKIKRLPNNLNFCVKGLEGVPLASKLEKVAASSGSSCNSSHPQPSHVLTALGVPEDLALNALRLSVGRNTTPEQIDIASNEIIALINRLRGIHV